RKRVIGQDSLEWRNKPPSVSVHKRLRQRSPGRSKQFNSVPEPALRKLVVVLALVPHTVVENSALYEARKPRVRFHTRMKRVHFAEYAVCGKERDFVPDLPVRQSLVEFRNQRRTGLHDAIGDALQQRMCPCIS